MGKLQKLKKESEERGFWETYSISDYYYLLSKGIEKEIREIA